MAQHVTYRWDESDMIAELDNMSLQTLGTKRIRGALRKEMVKARVYVAQRAHAAIPNDPRGSYRSVKKAVYRRGDILGANLSLYDKSVKSMSLGDVPRASASGIRRKRKVGSLTKRIRGYSGLNRAFILRWIEAGTDGRWTTTLKDSAYRGVIRPRPFFQAAARAAITQVSEGFNARLEKMIQRSIKAKEKKAAKK